MTHNKNPLLFLRFLDEFNEALQEQLEEDTQRHGGEYLERPRKGQSQRIFNRIAEYWLDFQHDSTPIPWLKVAGLAFIAWLRCTWPTLSSQWDEPDAWDDDLPVVVISLEDADHWCE